MRSGGQRRHGRWAAAVVAVAALAASGLGGSGACTARGEEEGVFVHPSDVPAPGAPGFESALLQATGVELQPGHHVELVNNGALFDAMQALIRDAKKSVHIVVFIWRPGEPSNSILEVLAEREAGVDCRVVVDPLGSTSDFEEAVQPALEGMGCEVQLFRPLTEVPQRERLARNHRKLVVVDGEVGLTGGFGIHTSWLGDGVTHENTWRETNVLVRGPAVRQMQLAFAEDWQNSGGALLPPEAFPRPSSLEEPGREVRAAFSASSPGPGDTEAERLTQLLIASAKERVWIANAYFVPSEPILRLLERKRAEGVDVRVLAAGPIHDWKIILEAQRAAYPRLLEAGVRLWEFQPSMMHAKSMLVDDRLSVVGSTNMDPLSLNRLEEGSLLVDDADLAAQLEAMFLADLEHSKEVTPEDLERPTPWRNLSRRVARLLGKWP